MARIKNIHLIGIGGCGVGAVGKILLEMGYKVSGSDIKENANTMRLKEMGAHLFFGHEASNVREADIVVYSSAISKDNPEILEAAARQIQIIPRAEMLSWIMAQSKVSIAVAGTHGKTTTTSMVSLVFDRTGQNPTFLIGGENNDVGGNARMGKGHYSIAEADESDGSFLLLKPKIEVITNIEADHLDYYSGIDMIFKSFLDFTDLLPDTGTLIICGDSENNRKLLLETGTQAKVITYGIEKEAQIMAKNIVPGEGSSKFEVFNKGRLLGEIKLNVPGRHNVENSLAAIACGLCAGLDFLAISSALRCFTGVKRRFQLIGKAMGVLIYDDYGHHPTEIEVTLRSARISWASVKRIICVFQPHRYSRTMHLRKEFGKCFADADMVIVTDIYAASEAPIEGISGETVVDEINKNGKKDVVYIQKKQDITDHLFEIVKEGDLVITAGAGDIYLIGKELYARLREAQRIMNPPNGK